VDPKIFPAALIWSWKDAKTRVRLIERSYNSSLNRLHEILEIGGLLLTSFKMYVSSLLIVADFRVAFLPLEAAEQGGAFLASSSFSLSFSRV